MSRLAYGLTRRTHGVRPSEKTALRVSPGFSPRGHLPWTVHPWRGGLCTPARETLPPPGDRPIRPPGVRLPPMIMLCLGLSPALPRGRTECVPPRKPPLASSPDIPRKAICNALTSRGGAGSARPSSRLRFHPGIAPLGHRVFVCPR